MAQLVGDTVAVRHHRRRRRLVSTPSLCLVLTLVWSSSVRATTPTPTVLGHDAEWWRVRIVTDQAFAFNGLHSDYSQQFLRLFLQGYTLPSVDGQLDLPSSVVDRIQANTNGNGSESVAFGDLSPLLQHALLWDMGVVRAGDTSFVQVYTRCGFHMNELAISRSIFEDAGCVAQACSTPRGDLFYQSLYCNGYQVGNVSRCATTRGKVPVHAAMWSDGGEEDTIPETELGKHEWSEWNDASRKYTIFGIHLKSNPNAYGKCIAPSMTVPCIDYEQLTSYEQSAWCEPIPSLLVTQWLQAESEVIRDQRHASKSSGSWGYILVTGLLALLLAIGWGFVLYRRRQRRAVERARRHHATGNDTALGVDDVVSYFFTDEPISSGRRGIGRDPQTTAVLGASGAGVVTGFTTKSSSARLPDHSSDLVFVNDSFQHHDYEGFASTRCGGLLMYASAASSGISQTTEYTVNGSSDDGIVAHPRSRLVVSTGEDTSIHTTSTTVMSSEWTASCSSRASTPTPGLSVSTTPLGMTPSLPETPSTPLHALLNDAKIVTKRVPLIDVSVYRCLSKGAYGEIWIGRMRDNLVAVKRLVAERRRNADDLDEFIAEIRLMAKFQHRNVLSLLGVAWNSPENLCMMMEYADRGDLQQLLRSKSDRDLTWFTEDHGLNNGDSDSLPGKKTEIAIDVAAGLRYLHGFSPVVVHRDLKSKNILLDSSLVAKLCDFGVSRVHEGAETMTCGVGTAYWSAPEVLVGDKYSESADVYSFGVVLNELNTHQVPFSTVIDAATGSRIETMRIMHLVCQGELTPSFSSECPVVIKELAQDCLQFDPLKRPSISEVLRRLQQILESNGDNGNTECRLSELEEHSVIDIDHRESTGETYSNGDVGSLSRESRADSMSSDSSGWV